ncbi:hypothetical protein PoB_004448100 [Plakobranchus ocellatus]|uniref:Uncharacterized protein n=1 Tax=Plakobranchus ocellatus TaxID=259542 RepID=A0AAV4BC15_9GAST|nr:hypothetical protein PoB_004448100 [Plakobranchus ocellatus]
MFTYTAAPYYSDKGTHCDPIEASRNKLGRHTPIPENDLRQLYTTSTRIRESSAELSQLKVSGKARLRSWNSHPDTGRLASRRVSKRSWPRKASSATATISHSGRIKKASVIRVASNLTPKYNCPMSRRYFPFKHGPRSSACPFQTNLYIGLMRRKEETCPLAGMRTVREQICSFDCELKNVIEC